MEEYNVSARGICRDWEVYHVIDLLTLYRAFALAVALRAVGAPVQIVTLHPAAHRRPVMTTLVKPKQPHREATPLSQTRG